MRKVIVTALAAGALAVGTALPSVAQAAEPGHVRAEAALSYGYFVNGDSGKCMDAGWSHANSTPVVQWDCYDAATQSWSWNGSAIVNVDSGKCLDAQWSHANSTAVVQYDCYGGATQQWAFRVNGDGYAIMNLDSGKCLDAVWSHANGTTLVQYDCYAGATQVWHG
jgi:hypothetical protein